MDYSIKKLLEDYTVVVPIIQRDYAQGRNRPYETEVRNNFLNNIFQVLQNSEGPDLRLNYIYGVPKDTELILIDGQQRITTLYLLWLYLAAKAKNKAEACYGNETRLNYESRTTSADFCKFLHDHAYKLLDGLTDSTSNEETPVRQCFINQKDFYKKWLNDPTVTGMITMLDAIHAKASKDKNCSYSSMLSNLDKVKFAFVSLDGFQREEELYATMNSRGKQLTPFEKLKTRLLQIEPEQESTQTDNTLESKINDGWYPQFWEYAKKIYKGEMKKVEDNHDTLLYHYYQFVVSMLVATNKGKVDELINDSIKAKDIKYPSAEDATDTLWPRGKNYDDDDRKNLKILTFAMDYFWDWFKDGNPGLDKVAGTKKNTNDYAPGNYLYFGEDIVGSKIIDHCCKNEKFTILERLLLWAFIMYQYKGSKDESLDDYLILMRDLYANAWDSNTPVSLDKNPRDYQSMRAVQRFPAIINNEHIDDKEKSSTQYNLWGNMSGEMRRVLNNPLTRGRSNNLSSLIGRSQEEQQRFADNLDMLYRDTLDALNHSAAFMRYQKLNINPWFSYVEKNSSKLRFFLPCSKEAFQSVLSLTAWSDGKDNNNMKMKEQLNSFIDKLCKVDLTGEVKTSDYKISDWEYYITKYSKLLEGNPYSAFEAEDGKTEPSLGMSVIYGQKAGAHQIKPALPYIAYLLSQEKPGEKEIVASDSKQQKKFEAFEDKFKPVVTYSDGSVQLTISGNEITKTFAQLEEVQSDVVLFIASEFEKYL